MSLYKDYSLLHTFLQQWLWKHGWEEPVGPVGPLHSMSEPWKLGPQPIPWHRVAGPQPDPWHVAVFQLIEAVQARDLAANLEGQFKEEAIRSATTAIDGILDDWCGTPPRKWPWPWPGPPPWTWEIASELSLAANSLQPGSLKDGLLDVAAQVVQKAAGGR
jgi:hypothetical protein